MKYKLRPALCLDLDGTVRVTKSGKPFAENIDDYQLNGDIENIIWRYKGMGWLILGISNQAGVAHGFKTPDDVELEMRLMFSLFKANPFDGVQQCYQDAAGKVEPYNHRSLFRKPDIGMLAQFEAEAFGQGFIVDWDNSLFVGDRPEDEQCAKNAGIPFRHIDNFLNEPHEFKI